MERRVSAKTIHFSVVDQPAAARVSDPNVASAKPGGSEEEYLEIPAGSASLLLYPNPTAGKLRLHYAGEQEEVLLLSIYNSAGQLICQKTGKGTLDEELDVSGQQPGIYVAVLLHSKHQTMQKFVVSK